jgi:predicted nucleic acid-binding protein
VTPTSVSGLSLYLDSNVLIYAFEGRHNTLREAASLIVRQVFSGENAGCTSVLTRAEVLVRPLELRQTELADRYRQLLVPTGPVEIRQVTAHVTDTAAELRADYSGLKLPDALHLASAIEADCGAFITGDKRLTAVSARVPVITLEQLTAPDIR